MEKGKHPFPHKREAVTRWERPLRNRFLTTPELRTNGREAVR